MLFKELKNIMVEADGEMENKSQQEQPVQRKPQQTVQDVKNASDGIGNEAYRMSNEIAVTLETDLTEYYHIYKVEASNNKITITADIDKMKDGNVTSKITGDAIPTETLLDTIQQIVIADAGKKINEFELNGPKTVAPGVMIITIVPV